GVPYSATLTGHNGTAPYQFTVTTGLLPHNLVLDPNTGAITGTPDTVASSTFTVTATDSLNQTGTQQYTININAPLAITTTTLVDWTQNIPNYSQTVNTTGGTSPLTFTLSAGILPHGLSLNAGSGAITGTPDTIANSTFTIKAQDNVGSFDTHQYTVHINA